MAINYDSIKTETFPSQIAKLIRASILEGKLSVNERLPTEEELATRFGVSRPTVREALKRLAAQNLIRSRRGPAGGTFVNGPNLEEAIDNLAAVTTMLVSVGDIPMSEISEARLQLEGVCVRLAAVRRTDRHLATLAAELEVQKNLDLTDVDFCGSDVRFHRTLVDAAGNALLRFLMGGLVEALQPVSNLIVFRYRDRREIIGLHQAILEHLRRRDPDRAAAVIEEQMTYLKDHYARAEAARRPADLARSG